mmetsp:Transcript_17854/g.27048  ORF Transcript_17854/g.27048 Transcript_17854/m.27048 type:complete len:168 (-) Transcript_17854:2602-3105(-)
MDAREHATNISESILKPSQRLEARKDQKARPWASCESENLFSKYFLHPFDRMVAIPEILSPSIAKIGDRAIDSNLFSSREVVTKIVRTFIKYHMRGGNASRIAGTAVHAVMIDPKTKKKHMRKSNSVCGNKSSLLPTSAENLFRILPEGLVSKNTILARNTDSVIAS